MLQMFGVTGESLGTIGRKAEKEKQEPGPEWKQILNAKPSVSIRKGIAWGTNPPTEPTSTIVLTSSKSLFIDIRFSLTGPHPTSPPHYWAFGGDCKSTFRSPDPTSTSTASTPSTRNPHSISFPCSMHTTWTRFLDSRGDITTPDRGTNYLLHNGDCLEVGEMLNPETGTMQSYQELWASPALEDDDGLASSTPHPNYPRSFPGDKPPTPTTSPPMQPQQKVRVTVAILYRPPTPSTNPDPEPKGMIIRIGPHCQGIIEIPASSSPTTTTTTTTNESRAAHDIVRVERWHLPPTSASTSTSLKPSPAAPTTTTTTTTTAEQKPEDSTSKHQKANASEGLPWTRDARSDYHEDQSRGIYMPCLWVCGQERKVGDVTEGGFGGGRWRVVEVERG